MGAVVLCSRVSPDLGPKGFVGLGHKVETPIPVSDPYLHPIKIPIPVIMAPKYKEHGSCSWHSRSTCRELLLMERQLT
jgi:hypothetical protein